MTQRKRRNNRLYDEKTMNAFQRAVHENPFRSISDISRELHVDASLLRNIMRGMCNAGYDQNAEQTEYTREYFRNNRYATDSEWAEHIKRPQPVAKYYRQKAGIAPLSQRICDDSVCVPNADIDCVKGFRSHRTKKYLTEKIAEELTNDVFASLEEIAKKYKVSRVHVVDGVAAMLYESGVVDRQSERRRLTVKFFDDNPFATDDEFASYIKRSEKVAIKIRRMANVPSLLTRISGYKTNGLAARIREISDRYPDKCGDDLIKEAARELNVPERIIDMHVVRNNDIDSNLRARFYEPMTIEEEETAMTYVNECIENGFGKPFERLHNENGVAHFRCDQLRKLIAQKHGYETYNDFYNDRKIESEFESTRCLRPESYVCDVCGEGFPGISLPDDMFKRYLELWEKKRQSDPRLRVDDLTLVLEDNDDDL